MNSLLFSFIKQCGYKLTSIQLKAIDSFYFNAGNVMSIYSDFLFIVVLFFMQGVSFHRITIIVKAIITSINVQTLYVLQ